MVYPVYKIKFKVGVKGLDSVEDTDMKEIADVESFSIAIDGNIVDWTPMNTDGWARKVMTGKSLSITCNGKRNNKDDGNNYIASLAWKDGLDCTTKVEVEFPNGDSLKFDAVVNVTETEGDESTNLSPLNFELQCDGKPVYAEKAAE